MPLREVFTLSEEARKDLFARLDAIDDDEEEYKQATIDNFWRDICEYNRIDFDTLKVWGEGRSVKFSAETLPIT